MPPEINPPGNTRTPLRMRSSSSTDHPGRTGRHNSLIDWGEGLLHKTPKSRKASLANPVKIKSPLAEKTDILVDALETTNSIQVGQASDGPIAQVTKLLEDDDAPTRSVFVELMVLTRVEPKLEKKKPGSKEKNLNDIVAVGSLPAEPLIWREQARWVKYEEMVEEQGERFSKPYISLHNIQPFLQLKNCLKHGSDTLLDVTFGTFEELVDQVIHTWEVRQLIQSNLLLPSESIRNILLAEKQHVQASGMVRLSTAAGRLTKVLSPSDPDLTNPISVDIPPSPVGSPGPASPISHHEDSPGTIGETRSSRDSTKGHQSRLLRKLPAGCETAMILVGVVDFLTAPIAEFIRFRNSRLLYPSMPEIELPTRFMFILLIPANHQYMNDAINIGRAFGSLMIDPVFARVAYKAFDNNILAQGIEEFLSQTLIVPPGKWNPESRWEPNEDMKPAKRHLPPKMEKPEIETDIEELEGLRFSGKPFGGLREDLQRKSKFYISDYTDAVRGRPTQIVAACLLLFIANATKIITFGGVMGKMLHGRMGAVENLLSGSICGIIYGIFSGQPLVAVSATGPTLVFEFIMFDLCEGWGWDFLAVRFWVGLWTAIFLVIIVATDASVIVAIITRFTEEAFATLISVIFIIQAVEEVMKIGHEAPVIANPEYLYDDPCLCSINGTHGSSFSPISMNNTKEDCLAVNGTLSGKLCEYAPDVFLFSVIIFFGTFFIAIGLKWFRHSGFLPSTLREAIADLNVTTAVVSMTLLSYFVGVKVPQLSVPPEFTPSMDRSWLINPLAIGEWWIALAAVVPGLFFTILVFMDQQITAVIVNRKDNLLRKGFGYHLDLLVVSVLMVVCALLGIPFYVAATIISIIHLESLRVRSQAAAPGEKPKFLGVNEQRVTAIVAHILVGLTITLTPVMKLIPFPALLGIFLYMGVVALAGQQFVQRVMIFFMPTKYQPDYSWLRIVHLKRIHLFTAIQIVSLIFLFVVKDTKSIAMAFPFMLVIMTTIRNVILAKIFTRKELQALDDITPPIKELFKVRKTKIYEINAQNSEPMIDIPKTVKKRNTESINGEKGVSFNLGATKTKEGKIDEETEHLVNDNNV